VFAYTASASVALCGRLGDALGRRRMSIAMLVVAGLGSMISARVDSLTGEILG
jgi:MFS family permease